MTNILAKEMIGLSFPSTIVSKMIEHDGRACIYGAFVSVDTNDILMNDEFPILDVRRKIISEDNGEGGFNVSSFMNEAIWKDFKRDFVIVLSRPLVMDFWWWCIIRGEAKWSNNLNVECSADTRIQQNNAWIYHMVDP
ncbi:hypothetical protein Tco_0645576 [Tanacetum coccineum]